MEAMLQGMSSMSNEVMSLVLSVLGIVTKSLPLYEGKTKLVTANGAQALMKSYHYELERGSDLYFIFDYQDADLLDLEEEIFWND